MIAQDANFRLKNRIRHSKYEDPCLAPGMAYFVDNKPYAEFIAKYAATQDDVSWMRPSHVAHTHIPLTCKLDRSGPAPGLLRCSMRSREIRRACGPLGSSR